MVAETARARHTAAELKAAARRLLVRKGYADTKVTDITAEAGKAVGVFYRYFSDKDALLRSLAEDFEEALHAEVVEHLGDDHGLETAQDVRRHVEAFWATYERHLPERVGVMQASMLSSEFRRIHHDLRERQVEIWAGHILTLDGGTDEQARVTALAVVCMLEYFCYCQFTDGAPVDPGLAIGALTSLIASGLHGDG
ncbi:hypothetical protein GCM10022224_094320 [Nonomuraea antimicrobica]|uniref:HTH tetR-type domain-containing protein n=1 Tax=Nonomuraea antimicrobica TaxID=561173 RepID=A0ABP7E639_9ACTN